MKKQNHLLMALCMLGATAAHAQKSVYIPQEWRVARTDTLLYAENDPENQYTWSKSRSRETDNVIIFWDKYYGNTSPSDAPSAYRVDIDDLSRRCEEFYALETSKLGFVDPENSNVAKYKIIVCLNHSTDWICYGGGYDYQVPALWLSPSTCKPVGYAVAHEVGHSFHYMCYSEDSEHGTLSNIQTGFHGAVGMGSVSWEQTAQWQANQSYPEQAFSQSLSIFNRSHNLAFTHEWHRYQSYWLFYYLCQKYNDIKTVANVWNTRVESVMDFNQVLMLNKNLTTEDLFRLYFDYASRTATFDYDAVAAYNQSNIGNFNYRAVVTGDREYQVALASCPQSTGFNVIPLAVPAAGTAVDIDFTGLSVGAALANGDPAEYLNGSSQFVSSGLTAYPRDLRIRRNRGFRLGYVMLLNDGTRQYVSEDKVYATGTEDATEALPTLTVPENVSRMWLIVSPAPTEYYQHKWDDAFPAGEDYWPYKFKVSGTDVLRNSNVKLYIAPKLGDRAMENITFNHDINLKASTTAYNSVTVSISDELLAALGTAFQLSIDDIAGRIINYTASGPKDGEIMCFAAKADGTPYSQGATANGIGWWFDANGAPCSWGATSRNFIEFGTGSMAFVVGLHPSNTQAGNTNTVRFGMKFRKSATEQATALFNFNITISNDANSATRGETLYDEAHATGITATPLQRTSSAGTVYSIDGRSVGPADDTSATLAGLQPGLYIISGRKVLVR